MMAKDIQIVKGRQKLVEANQAESYMCTYVSHVVLIDEISVSNYLRLDRCQRVSQIH